ncbi:unnamed protein product, partial [Prorocentrum cordatum]
LGLAATQFIVMSKGVAQDMEPSRPRQEGARGHRDLIGTLPFLPATWCSTSDGVLSGGGRRVTWVRSNRAIAALRGLARGHFKELRDWESHVSRGGWAQSTFLQKEIVRRVWNEQVKRATGGSVDDGRAVLRRYGEKLPVGYGGGSAAETGGGERLQRGALRPLRVSEEPGRLMLKSEAEIDMREYHKIKPYEAPELKHGKTRLELAVKMWESNMLQHVDEVREKLSVFTVVKKVEGTGSDKKVTSRLVWDARRVNLHFQTPPRVPLGSPAALAEIDLGPDVLGEKQFLTFPGDVPVMFYRLKNLPELYSYFVSDGVDPAELWEFARGRGVDLPPPPESAVG